MVEILIYRTYKTFVKLNINKKELKKTKRILKQELQMYRNIKKMIFNIKHQGNADQKSNEVSLHTSETGIPKKNKKNNTSVLA